MIRDWDDAYNNAGHISSAATFPPRWSAEGAAFRATMIGEARVELDIPYGEAPRERFDLFHPLGTNRGLAIFVHGGYWKAFQKADWSHLAAGALAQGWTVAIPGYTLAPEVRISAMTRQIGAAITALANRVPGPIVLSGHSAGGHLVTRMVCIDTPLPAAVQARIVHVLSISGVHDLRPLLRTRLNDVLALDPTEARAESPVLRDPAAGIRLTAWVGAAELPEFRRQARLLVNIWEGLDAETRTIEDAGRHHFDVIAGLTDPNSKITAAFTGADGWAG